MEVHQQTMIRVRTRGGGTTTEDTAVDDATVEDTATDDSASADTSASGDSDTLVIWSWGADEEKIAREDMVAAYQAANPDVKIEHSVVPTADGVWDQRMTAALAAGTGPDVIQMSPDWYGLFSDHFVDLNQFVERDGLDFDAVITEGMMTPYYAADGKLDGMPLLQNVFSLAYNADMFNEFGVDLPTADWTWDDVLAAAKQFASGSGADATYGLSTHWNLAQFSIIIKGGSPYSADLTTLELDTPEVRAGVDLFGEMIATGAMPDNAASQALPQEQQFVSGRAAMYIMGGFEAKLISDLIGDNFEWGAVSMPQVPGGTNNLRFATGYAMVNTSQNQDLAWDFMKSVSFDNDEMAEITARVGMPSNKHIAETVFAKQVNGPVANEVFLGGLDTARLWIWGGAFSEVGSIWDQVWESVTIQGVSADEAMEEYLPSLQRAWDEVTASN